MSYTVNGGTILTECVKLTTDTVTDLITAKGKTLVVALYAAEIAGATPAITFEKYDGTTSCYLANAKPLTARQLLQLDVLVNLKNGEKIRATASAANQIDVWVSYLAADKTAMGTFVPTGQR